MLVSLQFPSYLKTVIYRCSEMWLFRSGHHRCSIKKVIYKNFVKFSGITCAGVSFLIKFFNKNLIKKETPHKCFPVDFAKFLRIPFLQNTSRRLLLKNVGKYPGTQLNPFQSSVTFLYLLKTSEKTFGFLTFSGGIEM